ncbi:hypothetical protein EDF41_2278 [Curtobacterium sp. PhB171]|nr:hypothetical protein EDF41_2278 [Curtobacterium sp. PhB171]ROQ27944.1 hypothetical protein EDF40_1070 [Curtobacterium sp. PhB170]ROS34874.1 hypothetical protein EDF25_2102 [Curtobacterium sp. PhB131]
MQQVEDQLHQLEVDEEPAGLRAYLDTHPWHRELMHGELVASAYREAHRHSIAVGGPVAPGGSSSSAAYSLSPADAQRYLSEPLWVFVENEIEDGAFYRKVLGLLDARLGEILADERIVRFQHGGGKGELERLVTERAQADSQRGYRIRAVVVVDGDSRWPGDSSGNGRIARLANEAGYGFHSLSKRAIENYVPDESLRAYGDANPDVSFRVDWFLRLSSKQRDHHPIKRALDPEKFIGQRGAEGELYSGLKLEDLRGNSLPGLMKFFLAHPNVVWEELSRRDWSNDIPEIGDKIMEKR